MTTTTICLNRATIGTEEVVALYVGDEFVWPDPWDDLWNDGCPTLWANGWRDIWSTEQKN